MKPAAVINRGDHFVTLRATTDRPVEIQEALAARDVQHVFKGDQNQAWDAVLANHCLARAVGDGCAEITFFVQDERLGTADARLARTWRRAGRRYVLTEDYYRGRAGAVWEHQDVSYGLFFTETVSPEQFAAAGLHLHRAAAVWERHAPACLADGDWRAALGALGVTLPGHAPAAGAGTRLGPAAAAAELADLGADHPAALLYYAFTKTDGLYGVVPVENDNRTLSSIPAADPELRAAGAWLAVQASARGAMRLAGAAAHRRGIKARARRLLDWSRDFLREEPEATVTDFQAALGHWLTAEIFPADRLELDRTSHFAALVPEQLERLRRPEETLHYFLDLALRHPRDFTEAYNEALNRVGFGLQRMKYDPNTGHYTPPFFVEFAPAGTGTPVYRFGLELMGAAPVVITLRNAGVGDVTVSAPGPVRSARALAEALFGGLPGVRELVLVGKAAAFAAELQRSPRGLGLPRQGSKYAPMVDHLAAGLRRRGVLDQPSGLLIRIGLNALDRLDAMGDLSLRLPAFLHGCLGRHTTCRELARAWRGAAAEARAQLDLLGHMQVGQQVHLARLLCLGARGADLITAAAEHPGLARLLTRLSRAPEGGRLLPRLGADLPPESAACIERLLARRDELLARRREAAAAALAEPGRRGRLRPDVPPEAELERAAVECRLLLLCAAWVRRLWQRAESLPYLNDRPYTLALYLLFGRDVFPPICREVEFDVEYASPSPIPQEEPAATAARR